MYSICQQLSCKQDHSSKRNLSSTLLTLPLLFLPKMPHLLHKLYNKTRQIRNMLIVGRKYGMSHVSEYIQLKITSPLNNNKSIWHWLRGSDTLFLLLQATCWIEFYSGSHSIISLYFCSVYLKHFKHIFITFIKLQAHECASRILLQYL